MSHNTQFQYTACTSCYMGRSRLAAWVLVLWMLAAIVAGCAHTPEQLGWRMPTIRFEVSPDGSLEGYDAQALFEEANQFFDRALWRKSVVRYQRVIKDFRTNPYTYAAAYNAGLALMELRMYEEATGFFQLVSQSAEGELRQNARWNMLDLLLRQEQWLEARQMAKSLEAEITDDNRRRELIVLHDMLDIWLENRDANAIAEQLAEYRRMDRAGKVDSSLPIAIGSYLAGLVYAHSVSLDTLSQPASAQGSDGNSGDLIAAYGDMLEREAKALLEAQNWFLRAIRTSDVEWATAGVFRIGELYDRFYRGLIGLKLPDDLSPDERFLYVEELVQQVNPVKEKAETAYQKLLRFAANQQSDSVWVEKTRQELKSIQDFDPFSYWGIAPGPDDGAMHDSGSKANPPGDNAGQ